MYRTYFDNPPSNANHELEIISLKKTKKLAFHFPFNFSFEQCRHLKLILDHMELSRIGSDFFRPDIQVRGLVVEQVYHLELGRSPPRVQTELQDEYLIAFPSESLIIGKGPFKYCVIKRVGWMG